MHAEERHREILRRLRENGSVRVREVAAELGVSSITVRRDVEVLAERGLLARVHGGAVLPETAAGAAPASRSVGPGGRERVAGLVVPAADYYFPEVIKGAREAAAERGIRLVLGITQYDPEQERAQVRHLLAEGVDGLLITPCGPAGEVSLPDDAGVPYVLVERRAGDDAIDAEQVVSDHAYGARIAVRHLAEAGAGRTRIGLLLREDSPHRDAVREGFLAGLAAVGLPGAESSVFRLPAPGRPEERERVLREFTEAAATGRFDAALVHNDRDAIVLLQRLRAAGVRVPEEVAVVAYDDEVAALADIPLSAVAPPKHAVGAAAVDLLARRLADPDRARHRVTILPELRVRESSG
ncbi:MULTISPECIES: LacI family DNA-binding transcriptional regulator [unclassified Streptomyces]|uniref:LacI family DNA-binding transcriptional regulator n=1 Tax=unclassified Streptomyces TaxID=2593676 RepID=UPI0036FA8D26